MDELERFSLIESLIHTRYPKPNTNQQGTHINNASGHAMFSDVNPISASLEYTDIVAYPLLLVLCDALCNPGYVAYFLSTDQSHSLVKREGADVPVLSILPTRR